MPAKKEQTLQLSPRQADPLASQPLEMGVEGLIATIDDKGELIEAIKRSKSKLLNLIE